MLQKYIDIGIWCTTMFSAFVKHISNRWKCKKNIEIPIYIYDIQSTLLVGESGLNWYTILLLFIL